jgi:hypothetical protein
MHLRQQIKKMTNNIKINGICSYQNICSHSATEFVFANEWPSHSIQIYIYIYILCFLGLNYWIWVYCGKMRLWPYLIFFRQTPRLRSHYHPIIIFWMKWIEFSFSSTSSFTLGVSLNFFRVVCNLNISISYIFFVKK